MIPSPRIANIGPEQRRRRRVLGAWALAAGTGLMLLSLALGAAPWLKLALSPVFFAGFSGVFQARGHT